MSKVKAKFFLIGIPILFAAGSLFHFLYGFSGNMFVIGMITPVNESVFEHTKLFPVPAILWYILIYLLRKKELNANCWFTAALVSIVTQVSSLLFLYYFYTGAFNIYSVTVDIATFFVTVILGQIAGYFSYKRLKSLDYRLSLSLIFVILIIFAVFTVHPPRVPMFLDPITNTYGIYLST